jgi:hypothetical protein
MIQHMNKRKTTKKKHKSPHAKIKYLAHALTTRIFISIIWSQDSDVINYILNSLKKDEARVLSPQLYSAEPLTAKGIQKHQLYSHRI